MEAALFDSGVDCPYVSSPHVEAEGVNTAGFSPPSFVGLSLSMESPAPDVSHVVEFEEAGNTSLGRVSQSSVAKSFVGLCQSTEFSTPDLSLGVKFEGVEKARLDSQSSVAKSFVGLCQSTEFSTPDLSLGVKFEGVEKARLDSVEIVEPESVEKGEREMVEPEAVVKVESETVEKVEPESVEKVERERVELFERERVEPERVEPERLASRWQSLGILLAVVKSQKFFLDCLRIFQWLRKTFGMLGTGAGTVCLCGRS